jgi:hypothetical protein
MTLSPLKGKPPYADRPVIQPTHVSWGVRQLLLLGLLNLLWFAVFFFPRPSYGPIGNWIYVALLFYAIRCIGALGYLVALAYVSVRTARFRVWAVVLSPGIVVVGLIAGIESILLAAVLFVAFGLLVTRPPSPLSSRPTRAPGS